MAFLRSARETGSPVKLRSAWQKKKKKEKRRCWFHGNYRGHVDETLLRRVCPSRERPVSSKEETFSRILSQLWKIGPRIE